jgi:uncharacterized membrane protein YraQ (UPF0718 family)
MNSKSAVATNHHAVFGWMTVLLIAVVGLAIVKWIPYYQKAHVAAANHSIGASILMGNADRPPLPSIEAAADYALAYGKAIWKAMVLGLLLGSAIQTLLPRTWIESTLGGSGLRSVVVGGIFSLPGMMCTCCAAPVVVGLRECRAAPGSAVAFWLGNTVLNPATLVFTTFVLGWRWTMLRFAFGLVMVFGLGWLVNRLATPQESVQAEQASPLGVRDDVSVARWLMTFIRMSTRLIPEYVVLVLLLGAVRAWLFPHVGHDIDNSLTWIVTFALAGAIFVIPTAGEVPIVQAMLALGVGVGPAAALLMTLPPISAPSVVMLWRSLRPRTLGVVSLGVVLCGGGAGLVAAKLLA